MLVIRVEIWPGGDKSRARTVAEASAEDVSDLADVSGTDGLSDYQVFALETAHPETGLPARVGGFMLSGHPRRSSVWALVAQVALRAAIRFTPDRRAA